MTLVRTTPKMLMAAKHKKVLMPNDLNTLDPS